MTIPKSAISPKWKLIFEVLGLSRHHCLPTLQDRYRNEVVGGDWRRADACQRAYEKAVIKFQSFI